MACKWRLDDGQIEVVDEAVAAILRQKTPAQRVAMIFECNETMRLVVAGGVRRRHSDWNDVRVKAEVARRMSSESA